MKRSTNTFTKIKNPNLKGLPEIPELKMEDQLQTQHWILHPFEIPRDPARHTDYFVSYIYTLLIDTRVYLMFHNQHLV